MSYRPPPSKSTAKKPPPNKNAFQKAYKNQSQQPKGDAKSALSAAPGKSNEPTRKKSSTDSKKGLRAFLALTPEEKTRRKNVSKKIQLLLKQRKLVSSATSVDSDDAEKDIKRPPPPKRYKRPIEKLIKKIKLLRREDIPSDINIHHRRFRRPSFMGAAGTRKEVSIIHDVLTQKNMKVQPPVGWDYNKKQRRLLLGFRHRKLRNTWNFFGVLNGFGFCPRRYKPNSHIPDALFFVFNLLIFISTGVYFGVIYGSDGFIRVLSDTYDYELFRQNMPNRNNEGQQFWIKTAPFDYYGEWCYVTTQGMIWTIVLGMIGVYLADQKLHLAYVIGMLLTLISGGIIASKVASKDYCPDVEKVMDRLLNLLVDNYYEKIPAIDADGKPMLDSSGKAVEIRTYKAANLMDRIQRSMHCCGINNLNDYTSKNMSVPPSCCTPLWNLNPHCANVIPTDKLEYHAKLQISQGVDLGCLKVLETVCINIQRMMGPSTGLLNAVHWILFIFALWPLILQARQIRQLQRPPHLRISAGSISQSLQAAGGNEGSKGGGGVRAVVEASKFTEKQQERLQQVRRENLLKSEEHYDSSSESSEESSDELPVHTVNFGQLKNLQQFVDTEDKTKLEMPDIDKTVEGFAGRFNILANKSLQNYVSGIFSTTYQNETNAGLEAIAQTLERQFAQHTTDYNWRKLLTKPKAQGKRKETKTKDLPIKVTKVKKPVHQPQPDGSLPTATPSATSDEGSDEVDMEEP